MGREKERKGEVNEKEERKSSDICNGGNECMALWDARNCSGAWDNQSDNNKRYAGHNS